jgi:hypothetical protein
MIEPCPFCGAAGNLRLVAGISHVRCENEPCGAIGPPSAYGPVVAVERWNRRTAGGPLAQAIEAEMNHWRGANGGIHTIHACALAVARIVESRGVDE